MLLEFPLRGFSFADADRELMSVTPLVEYASRDYEYGWLVGNSGSERVNFEDVISSLSTE